MKRILSSAALLVVVAVALVSCAEEAPDRGLEISRKSFDAWITKNAPNAQAYGDIYMEYIEHGRGSASPVLNQSWISFNYTGRTLDGTVFATRSESISKRVGRFIYSTRYSSDFTAFNERNVKLCKGLHQALPLLHPGDSVRIYIPSDLSYFGGMGINSGYYGEISGVTYNGKPICMDIRLKEVVTDAGIWERDSVRRYALHHWGQTPDQEIKSPEDFLRVGLFLQKQVAHPDKPAIREDTLVTIYYAQYFMDGFLLETNVDTIAIKRNQVDQSSAYEEKEVAPWQIDQFPNNKMFAYVLVHMRRGEIADVASASVWTHGVDGKLDNYPEIAPYQPTLTRIWVVEKDENGDEVPFPELPPLFP